MNRLLGIKKRCVAGLAALFVIMITMVSVNASYEWCELMLDDAGVVTEEQALIRVQLLPPQSVSAAARRAEFSV